MTADLPPNGEFTDLLHSRELGRATAEVRAAFTISRLQFRPRLVGHAAGDALLSVARPLANVPA